MPKRYPPEFRRKVLDLLEAGRTVASIAHDLDVSDQTIYLWRRQDEVDRVLRPGLTREENKDVAAARRKIRELEAENAILKRSNELLKEVVRPKGSSRSSK